MFKKSLFLLLISAAIASTCLFSIPSGTTRAENYSSSNVSTTSPIRGAASRQKVTPLSPPTTCTLARRGQQWNDPVTGEIWECICYDKYHDGAKVTVCNWGLILNQPNPSTWINLKSGWLMDVYGGSTSNGARIDQSVSNGSLNQSWNMQPSVYGVPNMNLIGGHSNKCIGVNGGSTAQGASIIQWTCNNNADQLWVWGWTGRYASSGWPIWEPVNNKSAMCLGISGGSTANNAYAIQWSCNGNADQEWW